MASDLYGNVCAVIAFPHGNTLPEAKYAEALAAMDCGAKELDVVVNYGRFLDSGHHDAFWDIAGIVKAAHPRGVLVKAILETCYYTPDQIYASVPLVCRGRRGLREDIHRLRTRRGHARGRQDHAGSRRWRGPSESQRRHQDLRRRRPLPGLGCTRLGSSTYRELLP